MAEEEQVVEQPDEVTATPEAEKPETGTETAAKDEADKPNYYTPEEIEQIIESDGNFDPNRLSPEGKLLQKSFQRGFNPKLQERSDLKRRVAELEQRYQTPQKPPMTIDEAYDQNPTGTLSYIDGEISKWQAKMDEDPLNSFKQIESLRTVKDRLRDREIFSTKQQLRSRDVLDEVQGEVLDAIPDFHSKRDKLNNYAIDKLGFTPEEIAIQSDPLKVGPSAAKFVKMVNRSYDLENAKTTVTKKEVRPSVPKTETAGSGDKDTLNTQYAAAFKKAQKTGDWTDVLRIKGTLERLTPPA